MVDTIPTLFFGVPIFWLLMFSFQCRTSNSKKNFNGTAHILNYVFYSNLIFTFPKWLVTLLFFNYRLVKLPLPLVVGEALNHCFGILTLVEWFVFHQQNPTFYNTILIVWGVGCIGSLLSMIIDHEFYCYRFK